MRLSHLIAISIVVGSAWHSALAQTADANWGLAPLMQSLARVRSASANFSERQTVQMLNAPLMTSGSLTYVAPDYVRKVTLSPMPETFVLDGGVVTLTGGPNQQIQRFSLAEAPQIGGLVEGIRATLAGDLPALEKVYQIQLSGSVTNWQLFLQPKDANVTHFVKWIIIRGRQNQIDTVDTAGGDGNHSEMGITETFSDAR